MHLNEVLLISIHNIYFNGEIGEILVLFSWKKVPYLELWNQNNTVLHEFLIFSCKVSSLCWQTALGCILTNTRLTSRCTGITEKKQNKKKLLQTMKLNLAPKLGSTTCFP